MGAALGGRLSATTKGVLYGFLLALAVGLIAFPAGVWAADAFSDVPESNVYHDAVGAIVDAGITQGCSPDRYCPGQPVRRDQMASFMDRLGALSGQEPVVNAAAVGGVEARELLDRIEALESELAAATDRIDTLEATLGGVTRTTVDGRDALRFEGMNLQVVNGTDATHGDPNGLGNVIVGYNARRNLDHPAFQEPAERTGSHYLVVGDGHEWTAFGGILAGHSNTASGKSASVTGGSFNTASGKDASVSGGWVNEATGEMASVTGGSMNTAIGMFASISGGGSNRASGDLSSILGGMEHTAGTHHECHPGC